MAFYSGQLRRQIEQDNVVISRGRQILPWDSEPESWRTVSLGECVTISKDTYSPKEGWPFINYLETGAITDGSISEIKHLVVGEDKIPSRARRKVAPGDIVYSTVRPNQRHFGMIRDVPDNFLASTGFAVLRGKEGIASTEYIYWYLTQHHVVEYLHTIAEHSTSAYPSIRSYDIEQLSLELPSLEEQRAITRVLRTLDDKIELNRRTSETLEEVAEVLFKSWFVDFDPVRAKMGGRWRPDESLPGLPAHLYGLFPDRLIDSRLGPIPEGWQVDQLGNYAGITKGTSYRRTELAESDTALVTLKSFRRGGGYKSGGLKPYTGTYKSEQVLAPGDVIVACTDVTQAGEVIGRSARVVPTSRYRTLVASLDVMAIRPDLSRMNSAFLYQLCNSYRFVGLMRGFSTGTTVLHLAKSAISRFDFVVPPYNVLKMYNNFAQQLERRVDVNHIDNPILQTLRDCLLTPLLRP